MVALLLAGQLVLAAPPIPTNQLQQARELFERGRTEYHQGQFRQAVADFLAADRIRPSPVLVYNVAQAFEKLGDSAKAVDYYRSYLQRDPAASDRGAVEATIRNLEAQAPASPVVVVTNPGGAAPAAATQASPPPARRGHALALGLAGAAGVAAVLAVVGAIDVAGYQGVRAQVQAGSYKGSYTGLVNGSQSAQTWGIAAIALAVVTAAAGTGAVLTW